MEKSYALNRKALSSPQDTAVQDRAISHGEQIAAVVGEFLWEVDAEGLYTYAGGAAREITGYEPEELIGRAFWEILDDSCREAVRAAAQNAFGARSEIRSLVNEITTKDGRKVTVLKSGRPLLAADGTLLGYAGSDRDVTDLLRTQRDLQRFKGVMDQANFGIALAGADSVLTYANETFARDHGYAPEEIIGRPIAFLHSPEQMPRVSELVALIHTVGSFRGEEVWHRRKDGTEFPMLMTGILLTEPDGSHSIAATALDITARKKAERELVDARWRAEQSDRTKAAFLSMISHEFRTPLNHILGFSTLIEESASDPEIARFSAIIQKSADEFLQVVDDLIELSTAEVADIHPRQEVFRLSEVMNASENDLRKLLEAAGKSGSVHVDPYGPATLPPDIRTGDAPRLRLLLEPLLKNAVKFTASGTVGLTCDEPVPGRIRFRVRDTGCGIPCEKIAEVFGAFVQAEEGPTRHHQGMGIGLSVCRKIATVLGGEVRLATTGPEGTIVEVIVPLPSGPQAPPAASV